MSTKIQPQNDLTKHTTIVIPFDYAYLLHILASYVATLILGNSLIIVVNSYIPFIPKSITYLITPDVISLEHENMKMQSTIDSIRNSSMSSDELSSQENNPTSRNKRIVIILSIIAGVIFFLVFFGYIPGPTLVSLQEQLTNLVQNFETSRKLENIITTTNTNLDNLNISQKELIQCLRTVSALLTSYISKSKASDSLNSSDTAEE